MWLKADVSGCSRFSAAMAMGTLLTLTGPGATRLQASEILFVMNFNSVNLVQGTDPGGVDDMSLAVDLDHHGLASAGPNISMSNGETVNPNWRFIGELDPRGRSTYLIPIEFELSDYDTDDASTTLLDIAPGAAQKLSFIYDMESRTMTPAAPQAIGDQGPRAAMDFLIETNPFRYDFSLFNSTEETAPGVWSYSYGIVNSDESTFDLTHFEIPGFGAFSPTLEPGLSYRTPVVVSNIPPSLVMAAVDFGDLAGTRRLVPLFAPGPVIDETPETETPAAVPEPSSMALLLAGGLGMVVLGMRNRNSR